MTAADIAAKAYVKAGLDPAEPPGPFALAEAMGVPVCFDDRELLPCSPGAYCPVRHVVWLREGLPVDEASAVLFHELGHHAIDLAGVEQSEDLADAVAVELALPSATRAWLHAAGHGPDVVRRAYTFATEAFRERTVDLYEAV